jgi:hypothetical protein
MKGILFDEDGDLMVRNGNVVIGDVDCQILEHVLEAYPGEFKEAPTVGAHLADALNGSFDPFLEGKIKEMLKSQHIEVTRLNITEEGIELTIDN